MSIATSTTTSFITSLVKPGRRSFVGTTARCAAAVVAVAAFAGCSATATDYKAKAEEVIGTLAKDIDLGTLKTACDKPAKESPAVGDTFNCTATTADGQEITFVATVDKPKHINVESTNLVTKAAVAKLTEAAVASLEQSNGITIGTENMDCGTTSVIVDAADPQMVCALTDPSSGNIFDATITFDSLSNPQDINVSVADTPRS